MAQRGWLGLRSVATNACSERSEAVFNVTTMMKLSMLSMRTERFGIPLGHLASTTLPAALRPGFEE